MPDRLRILHLAATDSRGLDRAASRLHAGLLALDQDSSLLVREQTSRGNSTYQVDLELPPEVEQAAFLYDVFQRWYIDHNRTKLSNSLFTLGEPGLPIANHPLVDEAEILHLHNLGRFISPSVIASLAALGKPMVWTLHDQRPFTGGCHYSAGCAKFTTNCSGCPQLAWDPYFLTESQLSDAQQVIPARLITCVAPTKWMFNLARISSLLKNSRLEIIPYGIESERFEPRWKPQAKSHLGLDTDTFHLLFVANHLGETRKGFGNLARAIQHCLTHPKFKEKADKGQIALISLGHAHPSLNSIGIPYVSLGYMGTDAEMSQIYGAADLFLMPSLEENAPNTLLEAMSCGTPAVAFAAGGTPEIITHDKTGKLVPVGDDFMFGEAIEALLFDDDLRLNMGSNCRQTIMENFSSQQQAERYLELYSELMKGRRVPPRPATEEFGFPGPQDFAVTQLAPIGARTQHICSDSLPKPLQEYVVATESKATTEKAELREALTRLDAAQRSIEQLEAELDESRGVLRKQETTILQQNQILSSGAIRMLRQLKIIKK